MKSRKVSGFSIASLLGRKDSESETNITSDSTCSSSGSPDIIDDNCVEDNFTSVPDQNPGCTSCRGLDNKTNSKRSHSCYSPLSSYEKSGHHFFQNGENAKKLHMFQTDFIGYGRSYMPFPHRTLHNGHEPPYLPQHHSVLIPQPKDLFPHYSWPVPLSRDHLQSRLHGTDQGLLLSHFRKPKRIRTAFSPSQLLRLEHAFESNHYVVGQERKELATVLTLSETQVKVWFQNRRTKYKRMKAEDEMTKTLSRKLEQHNSDGNSASTQNKRTKVCSKSKNNTGCIEDSESEEYENEIELL